MADEKRDRNPIPEGFPPVTLPDASKDVNEIVRIRLLPKPQPVVHRNEEYSINGTTYHASSERPMEMPRFAADHFGGYEEVPAEPEEKPELPAKKE